MLNSINIMTKPSIRLPMQLLCSLFHPQHLPSIYPPSAPSQIQNLPHLTIMFLNESEISLAVGGAGRSTTADMPCAILSSINFNSTGGTPSSVALIVNRTICK